MKRFKSFNSIVILIFGMVLLIIALLFITTRPAIFNAFDLTNTGNIGDTIGGISSVIIGIVSTILIYLSFQSQFDANQLQIKIIRDERRKNLLDNQFEKYSNSFEEIKKNYLNIEFSINSDKLEKVKGIYALNSYINILRHNPTRDFDDDSYPFFDILLTLEFLLSSILSLINRIEKNMVNKDDKNFILTEIFLFYEGYLMKFLKTIISLHNENEFYIINNIAKLKSEIDTKIIDIKDIN